MDLFVVNRYEEEEEDDEESVVSDDEAYKLNKIIKRIERNKAKIQKQDDEDINKDDQDVEENEPPEKKLKTEVPGFTILSTNKNKQRLEVTKVLPALFRDATIIPTDLGDLDIRFSSIKALNKSLRSKLKEAGYKHLFPVQKFVIPFMLENIRTHNYLRPNDICVSAPTGSGKTLCFVLPIIQALQNYTTRQIRALIIVPTQPLAMQIESVFAKFKSGTDIKVGLILGGKPINEERADLIENNSVFGYLSKIDVLICTGGRLVDHLTNTKGFTLEHLEYLIIDEADVVVENMHQDWMYHFEKHINKGAISIRGSRIININTIKTQRWPQKLLFSATLTHDAEKLEKLKLFQPKLFTAVAYTGDNNKINTKIVVPSTLTERYIECESDLKPLILYHIIKEHDLKKTIIFTHSVETTHRLRLLLNIMLGEEKTIFETSGQLSNEKKLKLTRDFENGKIDFLVSTDVFTRGLDLQGVECVISYSHSPHLETYIHRVGRTARAGEKGLAILFVSEKDKKSFNWMHKQGIQAGDDCKMEIDSSVLESLIPLYQKALNELKHNIFTENRFDLIKIDKALGHFKSKRNKS